MLYIYTVKMIVKEKREYTRQLGDNRPRTVADADPCGPPNHTYYAKKITFFCFFLFLIFLNDNPSFLSTILSIYQQSWSSLTIVMPVPDNNSTITVILLRRRRSIRRRITLCGGPAVRVLCLVAEKWKRQRERKRGVVKRLERMGLCERTRHITWLI